MWPIFTTKLILTVLGAFIFSDKEVCDHFFNKIHGFTAPYDQGVVMRMNTVISNMREYKTRLIIDPYETIQPLFNPYELITQMWFGNRTYNMQDEANITFVFVESDAGFVVNGSNKTSYDFQWSNETQEENTTKADPVKQMYQMAIIRLLNELERKENTIRQLSEECMREKKMNTEKFNSLRAQFKTRETAEIVIIFFLLFFIYSIKNLSTIADYKAFMVNSVLMIITVVCIYNYATVWEIIQNLW